MRTDWKIWTRAGLVALGLAAMVACDDDSTGPDDGGGVIPPGTAVVQGTITANRTFAAETTYVLSGFVKVASGATLTIMPGTKIVGDSTVAGSSLFIKRGGKIMAEGTAEKPIVFTSQRAAGNRKPGDWGGIVIVGNARVNRSVPSLQTEGPGAAAENYAGGTDDNDSSGSLKYVRIEFAGYNVSGGQGQELNSLSMYAVGRGTKLQYVQVHAGLDDGFEWFGGTVDGQYLVSSEAGDDHFDWTEGYRGRNQFLVAFRTTRLVPANGAGGLGGDPRGFEGDGCEPGLAGCDSNFRLNLPLSNPVFANFTAIGARTTGFPTGGNAAGLVIRRGSNANFYNGIVARFNGPGISVRDTSANFLAEGSVVIRNVALLENAANFDTGQEASFANAGLTQPTTTAAAVFNSLATPAPNFLPTTAANFVTGGVAVPTDLFSGYGYGFTNATYLGAFGPGGQNWMAGWTDFSLN